MIDRPGRSDLAVLLRRLASGHLSATEFDQRRPHGSADLGLQAVANAGWTRYGEPRPARRAHGQPFRNPTLRQLGLCILFLQTDLEYEWGPAPIPTGIRRLLHTLKLGWLDRRTRRAWMAWETQGDADVWPFFRYVDYESAAATRLTGLPAEATSNPPTAPAYGRPTG